LACAELRFLAEGYQRPFISPIVGDASASSKGATVKKHWEPMRLRFVGRVSEFMRGVNGTNIDPGHDNNAKLGGG
jgi:hypothetical protein